MSLSPYMTHISAWFSRPHLKNIFDGAVTEGKLFLRLSSNPHYGFSGILTPLKNKKKTQPQNSTQSFNAFIGIFNVSIINNS